MKKLFVMLPALFLLSACWWNKPKDLEVKPIDTEAGVTVEQEQVTGTPSEKAEEYLRRANAAKEDALNTIEQEKAEKDAPAKKIKTSSFFIQTVYAEETAPKTKDELLSDIEGNVELALKAASEEKDVATLVDLLDEIQNAQEDLTSDLRDAHDAVANQTAGVLEESQKVVGLAMQDVADAIDNGETTVSIDIPTLLSEKDGKFFYNREEAVKKRAERIDTWFLKKAEVFKKLNLTTEQITAKKKEMISAVEQKMGERKMARQEILAKVQSGELTPEDGQQQIFEMRKVRRQTFFENHYTALNTKSPEKAAAFKVKFDALQLKLDPRFAERQIVFQKNKAVREELKKIWEDLKTQKDDMKAKTEAGTMTADAQRTELQKIKDAAKAKATELRTNLKEELKTIKKAPVTSTTTTATADADKDDDTKEDKDKE